LEQKIDAFGALRIREFFLFLTGKMCFTLALQMQGTIVGLQVYHLTKDELALGMIGGAEAVPAILIALFGGWVADHYNRRNIVLISLGALVVLTLLLLGISMNVGSVLKIFGVYPIYAVIFFTGIARAFIGPAQFALLAQTLPNKDYYKNAISWNSFVWQATMVAGPPIGALVYSYFGVDFAYGLDFILLLISVGLFLLMVSKAVPETKADVSIVESLKEGLSFVFGKQEILWAMSLDMFAVLFGGAVAMMPAFCDKVLHVGPEYVGLLRSAPAIGSVSMMLLFTYFPIRKKAGIKMLWAVVGFALSMMAFAFSENYILSVFILAVSGAFDAVSVIIRQTLLQTLTPENMKGRVSAVSNIFVGSSNEIGEVESGVAARMLGLQRSVVVGSFISLLVVGVAFAKAKKLLKLDL
jgi:MFS family permease